MNRNLKKLTLLPSQQLLQQIWEHIISRPRKRGEHKKNIYECLFLLGWKVGLRISEAISFDLNLVNPQEQFSKLYLVRGKHQKERWVYVSSEVVSKLRQRKWRPQQTKRSSFFSFLQQIKQELELTSNIELAPHTLRRCFATHNAIAGMPLPVLQKVLGHSKISTTALYIRDSDLNNLVKYKPI